MFEESIKGFMGQLAWEPTVEYNFELRAFLHVVVGGMGGSHLAADLLSLYKLPYNIHVHSDYGLPDLPEYMLKDTLFIASSYSGNTEETLDFAEAAHKAGRNLAIIASGGKLLQFARAHHVPHVVMPSEGIQPRAALGYSLLAHAAILREQKIVEDLRDIALTTKSINYKKDGDAVAKKMVGFIPVIYSSKKNESLAYIWKVNFNETAKIPAFVNTFPELNHNELNAFGGAGEKKYKSLFKFIFIRDETDHPRIQKRMDATKEVYAMQGLEVLDTKLSGITTAQIIVRNMLVSEWASLSLAGALKADPDTVPVIEDFKKKIN